jgi:flagellar protein FlhE
MMAGARANRPVRVICALAIGLLSLGPEWAVADGSWVASAPPLRVIAGDRETVSDPLSPPIEVPNGSLIREVMWRIRAPVGLTVQARLCQAGDCILLPTARGRSPGLMGLPADQPLRFRFSLRPGQRRAVLVQGLQVIVNYEHKAP